MKLTFMDTLIAIGIVTCVLSSGCDQQAQFPEAEKSARKAARVSVERVSELEAGKARFVVDHHGTFYAGVDNNRRDILVIHDLKTKVDYLAITGVGTSELKKESTTIMTIDAEGHPHTQTTTETKER